MNKDFILLAIILLIPSTLAYYDFPVTNFTMNFLKDLGIHRTSRNYLSCHMNMNHTLYALLYLPYEFSARGPEQGIESIMNILSDLYDINGTCYFSLKEISYAFSRYLIKLLRNSIIKPFLLNLFKNSISIFTLALQVEPFYRSKDWAKLGSTIGQLCNLVFNITIESFTLPITSYTEEIFTSSNIGEVIFNATLYFFEGSGLFPKENLTFECVRYSTKFYTKFVKALNMLAEGHTGGLNQLLFSFTELRSINFGCKNVTKDFVKTFRSYLERSKNHELILNRLIFRCKDLTSRGKLLYQAFVAPDYQTFAYHVGHIVRAILGP